MKLDWIPRKSIGILEFEKKIDLSVFTNDIKLVKKYCNDEPWVVYEFINHNTRMSIENDLLISVECAQECFYKNKNIIGMDINNVIKFLNINDAVYEESYEEIEISSADLGIMIWVENDYVESVTVYKY